ncbi:hypothetical protein NX059_011743 [Plenodomus lindquistii]|nr:hypothetical protein NX059_011743 [Plenodomus lindquistii]
MFSLCIYCIRRRRQVVPPSRPPPKVKKPALRRAEARKRLDEVTEVSSGTAEPDAERTDAVVNKSTVETRSVLGQECAICLSTLHAPAPPEPVKLSDAPITDEAAKPPSIKDGATSEPDTILRLQVCQHEFHAECLVSWFVLRKRSCPICRADYYSKEAMQAHDDEEAAALAALEPAQTPAALEAQTPAPVVRNWRFFLYGHGVAGRQGRNGNAAVEMQPTSAPTEGVTNQTEATSQPHRSWWQRLRGEL